MSDSFETMDCSLLGSSVHGILQAGILEWVAISFSKKINKYKKREREKGRLFFPFRWRGKRSPFSSLKPKKVDTKRSVLFFQLKYSSVELYNVILISPCKSLFIF